MASIILAGTRNCSLIVAREFQLPAVATSPSKQVASNQQRLSDPGRILELSVPVSVVLAERLMTIDEIVATQAGTIIEFDVPFDSELTLYVANSEIGHGQAVKIGENFGLRINRIGTVRQRIDAMRGPD